MIQHYQRSYFRDRDTLQNIYSSLSLWDHCGQLLCTTDFNEKTYAIQIMNDEFVIILHQATIAVAATSGDKICIVGKCKRQDQEDEFQHLYFAIAEETIALLTPIGLYLYETFQFESSFGFLVYKIISHIFLSFLVCAIYENNL